MRGSERPNAKITIKYRHTKNCVEKCPIVPASVIDNGGLVG